MKLKKGEIEVEFDAEKLIEKGMKHHEKNWRDKFNIKHKAKKEMIEIKHKQKMEIEEKNKEKKNWFQKIEEERRKTKELKLRLELEEKRRQEEERKRILQIKMRVSTILGIIGSVLLFIGYFLGTASRNSAWDGLMVIGFLALISIVFIWAGNKKNNKNKKKR